MTADSWFCWMLSTTTLARKEIISGLTRHNSLPIGTRTPWGDGINFDGLDSRVVRDFFIHNALYWLTEYHFDGLRLDAVHAIIDDSTPHILTELADAVRSSVEPDRHVHLILENDHNQARYLQRTERCQPQAYTAQWNDDIHHALHVLITGERDGYYADYSQRPIDQLGRCLADGFAYQGEISLHRNGETRGEPTEGLPPTAFVSFLQNHDQVGNRAFGERIIQIADRRAVRAAAAILLLAPSPPLLFMGEEFGAETPFLFFCDFEKDLAAAVTAGRRNEFAHFARFNDPAERERIPDPERCQQPLRPHSSTGASLRNRAIETGCASIANYWDYGVSTLSPVFQLDAPSTRITKSTEIGASPRIGNFQTSRNSF